MVYEPEEGNYLEEAIEELKRVDHLIFVSLKYTRTVDVLKNVLKRLITTFGCVIDGVLGDARDEKKIMEVPLAPVKKCSALKELIPGKYDELIDFFLYLRKLDRAEYDKINEFRRHVALIAHTEDEGDVEVSIDVVTEYYRKATTLIEALTKKPED
ncbi:hypothetical protein HN695_01845 [Candidatus Woesearchaeota archaeon]|jgi:hypothetical protein|nr:hypothetical protein [Candidatus Woesearchaeota archaeon]MBT5273141.1 hypothetical protein [Candidatus Woesearchaeota archaeon]MBT6041626.1 hypothetical protein [Candidatus Woesearchaeota archaeon]MBT6337544.1 hypothetical protein [Candidatus Woesearchaeota archaeon]MBT7927055.1 hypothetical protein [Candidatus Woesearchaeota archaeon]